MTFTWYISSLEYAYISDRPKLASAQSQALQMQSQTLQTLQDQHVKILTTVVPLLPLLQAVPLHIEKASAQVRELIRGTQPTLAATLRRGGPDPPAPMDNQTQISQAPVSSPTLTPPPSLPQPTSSAKRQRSPEVLNDPLFGSRTLKRRKRTLSVWNESESTALPGQLPTAPPARRFVRRESPPGRSLALHLPSSREPLRTISLTPRNGPHTEKGRIASDRGSVCSPQSSFSRLSLVPPPSPSLAEARIARLGKIPSPSLSLSEARIAHLAKLPSMLTAPAPIVNNAEFVSVRF